MDRSFAGDSQRRPVCAGAVHSESAVDRSGDPGITHPADVEIAAESPDIDVVDFAIGAESERFDAGIDRAGHPLAERRA